MAQFYAILIAVFALALALFAVQNTQALTVSFGPWSFTASQAAVILGAAFAGAIIGILLGLRGQIRARRAARKAEDRYPSCEALGKDLAELAEQSGWDTRADTLVSVLLGPSAES